MKHSNIVFLFNLLLIILPTELLGSAPNALLGNPTTLVDNESICISRSLDIIEKLTCIDGLTTTEITDQGKDNEYRLFDIKFEQPVDHSQLSGPWFYQRIILAHREDSEPMVLNTEGYQIASTRRKSATTALFQTNQMQIEHRFYGSSVPKSLDWSKLTVKQSVEDIHRVVVAFKKIYKKNWLSTGGSKNGMTAIYHRRYYPSDVTATLADAAPHTLSLEDSRYIDFIRNVGGAEYEDCRNNLKSLQIKLLENRAPYVERIAANSLTNSQQAESYFEDAIIELPFLFWQFINPDNPVDGCSVIPYLTTEDDYYKFVKSVTYMLPAENATIAPTFSYYYQALTELGTEGLDLDHIKHLLNFKHGYETHIPSGINYSYSNSTMLDVSSWLQNDAEKILFIYGEFDPWSSTAFNYGSTNKQIYRYTVPKGNHDSRFTDLPKTEQLEVVELLERWLEKKRP